MSLHSIFTSLSRRLLRGGRRVWKTSERTHAQLPRLEPHEWQALAPELERELEALEGVRWARVNSALGRIVIEHGDVPLERLIERLDAVEQRLGLGDREFPADAQNPGDEEPIRWTAVEIGADIASFAVSTALRAHHKAVLPFDLNLATLVAFVEGVPRIRRQMEQRLSKQALDLTLALTKASLQIALKSETGPAASFVAHYLRFKEKRARQRTWCEREPELCSNPDRQPRGVVDPGPRPQPLRDGFIERYERQAIPIALGAFGVGLVSTGDVASAATGIFAGLPRAARQGREAFARELGSLLSERGALLLDDAVLRRLDRLDIVVMTADVIAARNPVVERFVESTHAAGLRLVIAGRTNGKTRWAGAEQFVAGGAGLLPSLRKLQSDGAGVLLVATHAPTEVWSAADVAVALDSDPPPWGADIVCRWGLDDATLLVEACGVACDASRQAVWLAGLEAGVAVALSFGGLKRRTTRRVMTAANVASAFAMLNGARHARRLARPVERRAAPAPSFHTMDAAEVLRAVDSRESGLSSEQAAGRKSPAVAEPTAQASLLAMIKQELDTPTTPVLAAGAALSALVGSIGDAGLVTGALGINGLIGGIERLRTERALRSISKRERRPVRVLRDGEPAAVKGDDVVVGDVVELAPGDVVPADCRILEENALEVDESTLTGESLPVKKTAEPTAGATVADRASMVYEGTSIAAGNAHAVVVATGEGTEAGRAYIERSGDSRGSRGVEARLEQLSAITLPAGAAGAVVLVASGLLRGRAMNDVVSSAVGLAVAAVPEGLPLLATIAQLAAARRLSSEGVLVRAPRALEALGRVNVLCADKTGTLTEGKIRLELVTDGKDSQPVNELDERGRAIIAAAVRASPEREAAERLPHPTDNALLDGANSAGVTIDQDIQQRRRAAELPFEPARGFHASLDVGDGACLLSVKGAPEVVLPKCVARRSREGDEALDDQGREELVRVAVALARRGHRVLAVAEREASDASDIDESAVDDLVFLGFIGYSDPVRPSAKAALGELARAGVAVVMITGDHPSTATAIACELGLVDDHGVLTGAELEALDDDELCAKVSEISVFARVTPAQKVRIVNALKTTGRVVAMAGDGANDAPAIHLADVGIALGEQSTAAARNAADLVITDGRLETIGRAVVEGRALWRSVRDAAAILVGGNLGEIGFVATAGLLSGLSPLNARQLLLVNLVTDTLPALAIAVRPPRYATADELLKEGPDVSLGEALERDVTLRALLTAGAAGTAWLGSRVLRAHPARSGTVAMLALTGAQLAQTLVTGGASRGVLAAGVGSMAAVLAIVETPGVSQFIGCRPLGPIGLFQASAASAGAAALSAILPKLAERRVRRQRQSAPSELELAQPTPPPKRERLPVIPAALA